MSTKTEIPLCIPWGVPGFDPSHATATLVRGSGNVMALRIGDELLPVAVPWEINPDFGYRFRDEDTNGLGDPTDWLVLCVVNLPREGRTHGTLNQFSPIVVNERLGLARQVVNRAKGYSTRDPFDLAGAR